MISKAHWGYDDIFMDACREELNYSEDYIDSAHVHFWLAELLENEMAGRMSSQQNRIAGFIAMQLNENGSSIVEALFVHPSAMHKSIGRTLFRKALSEAKAQGVTDLLVHSDPNAEPFYQKLGFETIDWIESGSIKGRLLPLMKMQLKM
mmetsp:Transcript_51823/g.165454  ORF Transcript_51823/g.165454 Transcript_51823/m.165454 type:complete len:149 (+) Transcript_51823:157-603(+)